MDRGLNAAAQLTGVRRKATAPHHSSPWVYREEEEGGRVLTMASVGGGATRFGRAMSMIGGGGTSSTREHFGHGWSDLRSQMETGTKV
jgi:hypothetical protein